jgi:putative membrane protein
MQTTRRGLFLSMSMAALLTAGAAGAALAQPMGQPNPNPPPPPPNAGDLSNGPMAPLDSPPMGSDVRGHDRHFMEDAARGGMEEVRLGKLAVDRAASPDVRSFGQRMIDDHSRADDQLRQLAARDGVELPADVGHKGREAYDHLAKLSGPEFDRAYIRMMVKDHKDDIDDFRKAADHSTDPDVRHFASATLPTLRDHLRMAQDIQDRMDHVGRGRQ